MAALISQAECLSSWAKSLFNQGHDADCTIRVRNEKEWKLHKVILSRNSFFAGAFHSGFVEFRNGIVNLDDDDATAVDQLLRHTYSYDYDVPYANMSEHIMTSATADKYNEPRLMNAVKDKFAATLACRKCAHSDQDYLKPVIFQLLVDQVYVIKPSAASGLRDALVTYARRNFSEFFDYGKSQEMRDLYAAHPNFAFDLAIGQSENICGIDPDHGIPALTEDSTPELCFVCSRALRNHPIAWRARSEKGQSSNSPVP